MVCHYHVREVTNIYNYKNGNMFLTNTTNNSLPTRAQTGRINRTEDFAEDTKRKVAEMAAMHWGYL